MNTYRMAVNNMKQRMLSSFLTAFLVAVGVALISALFMIREQVEDSYSKGVAGRIDLVVGPKGDPLQLVLNSVFHMGKPLGNIPYSLYEKFQDDDQRVKLAIPMAVGDNYKGYRIVGTETVFLERFEHRKNERFKLKGQVFKKNFEAVVGYDVSKKAGLTVGSTFLASHGIAEGGHQHEHTFKVVGVLEPTATPHDRAIFCTLDSVYHLHTDSGGRMLSAILLTMHHDILVGQYVREVNDGTIAQAAIPNFEIGKILEIIGAVLNVFIIVSYLVLLSVGISIFVSLYNSMSERKREIAIVRALGAPAFTIFTMILLEAGIICLIGSLFGVTLSHVGIFLCESLLRDTFKLIIFAGLPGINDVMIIAGSLVLGILSAIIPAVNAYRTEIANHIRPVA